MKKSKQKEKIQSELDSNFSDLDWSEIMEGSIGINTHNLKILDKNTVVSEPTILLQKVSRIFLLVGQLLIGIGVIRGFISMRGDAIFLIIFGSAFIFFGLLAKGLGSRSFVFDGYNKVYRDEVHRREDPWVSFFYKKRKDIHVDFDDIIAVQFLRYYDSDSNDVYQINVVLHDKSRINIVNYGNEEVARKDAIYLAEFLGVPFLEKTLKS